MAEYAGWGESGEEQMRIGGNAEQGKEWAKALAAYKSALSYFKKEKDERGQRDAQEAIQDMNRKLNTKDSLSPIPTRSRTKDRVLGKGAVGDGGPSQDAWYEFNENCKTPNGKIVHTGPRADRALKLIAKKYGKEEAAACARSAGRAQDSLSTIPTKNKGAVGDLSPIPVAKKPGWNGTSAALRTPEDVERVYAKHTPEEIKKSFGKDGDLWRAKASEAKQDAVKLSNANGGAKVYIIEKDGKYAAWWDRRSGRVVGVVKERAKDAADPKPVRVNNPALAPKFIPRSKRPKAEDEHEGFKKLEGKLSHEKGVTDPAALAASIGRKKYGEKGMERKAAAGRGKDVRPVPMRGRDSATQRWSSTRRIGRDADTEGTYDVSYHDKAKGNTHSRDITIMASSWDDAMRKARAGIRSGEELYRVSPRDKNAAWAKDVAPIPVRRRA